MNMNNLNVQTIWSCVLLKRRSIIIGPNSIYDPE